jgi:hypothetical protein
MVILALVVGGFASYYLFQLNNPRYPVTQTTHKAETYTVNLHTGLRLGSVLDVTQAKSGEPIRITMNETNTLPQRVNMTSAKNWSLPHLTLGGCGTGNLPFGLEVLRGYYTQANVSSAVSLELFPPGPYNCPAIMSIQYYSFRPLSDSFSFYPTMHAVQTPAIASVTVTGYYSSGTLHNLEPGIYTIAMGDEWGQLELLYFFVTA